MLSPILLKLQYAKALIKLVNSNQASVRQIDFALRPTPKWLYGKTLRAPFISNCARVKMAATLAEAFSTDSHGTS